MFFFPVTHSVCASDIYIVEEQIDSCILFFDILNSLLFFA